MLLDSSKERIFGLDFMRAGAILLVLFGHCLFIYPNASGYMAALMQICAFLGVEIFFVLSGFLIGGILYRHYIGEHFDFGTVSRFVRRRWFRTLPNYYLALLINIIISFSFIASDNEIWKYALFLQNFSGSMPLFFPESWSLSIEEYSYLLLPLLLLVSSLFFKPKNRSGFFLASTVFLILFFVMTKVGFHFSTHNTDMDRWNSSLKSIIIYRLDSIFIGVLCSWMAVNLASFWQRHSILFCILGFLMLGAMFVGVGYFQIAIERFPFFWNVCYLPWVSVTISLFLPILSTWKSSNSMLAKPIVFISIISYAIYLLHYSIILQLFRRYFADFFGAHWLTLAYLAVTMGASYLLYRFYEKPMMDLREKL